MTIDPGDEPLGAGFCAMILSGGLARRAAGINKSFLLIEGRPILELQLEALRPLFAERIGVVTDRPRDFDGYNLACYEDIALPEARKGERSSLRGLASALGSADAEWVFLLAADMPWPDPGALRAQAGYLLKQQRPGSEATGICLRSVGGIEPFHAIYNRGLAGSAARALAAGEGLSLRRWIGREAGIIAATAGELGVAPERIERCAANLNEPGGAK